MKYCGKKVVVIGKGVSGNGAAKALTTLGADVTMIDGENELPEESFDFAVVSPGLPPKHRIFGILAKKNISITTDIGLGSAINTAPVTAITGTNGKTTTVEMLGAVYAEAGVTTAVCGNIGVSFSERASAGGYDRVVLELSSFQLMRAEPLRAHIACILNITPDHLDYHGDMESYTAAKLHIADRQQRGDFLLVPEDLSLSGISGTPEVLREGCDFYADEFLTVAGKRIMPVKELAVRGEHNAKNALYAAAAAYADGVCEDDIRSALSSFVPDKHRIAEAGACGGTRFYDDSKGTNPAATLAAAACMDGNTALIAGGSDKNCDYAYMFINMPANVTAVFLTGGNAEKMAAAAKRAGHCSVTVCGTLRECVELAGRGGFDSVLFSPASASFDRYSGYAERGEAFEREVERLISQAD